jgi:transcription antitermination factor NusG
MVAERPINWDDVLPPYVPPGIVRPGRSRWHALLVFPQRERAAKVWLARWQVEAFYPVKIEHIRKRGFLRPVAYNYLPGYLFANFPGAPTWHRIMGRDNERRLIRDVLRMSDGLTPGELVPETLEKLLAMRDMDATIEEQSRLRRMLKPGDRARFNGGPLTGQEVEIVSVDTHDRAKFNLKIFGAAPGEASVDMLDKIEETKP